MGFLKTLFGGTPSTGDKRAGSEKSIGHALLDRYRSFTSTKDAATEAALSVLWHGQTQFIEGPSGDIIRAADSDIPLSVRLQSFRDRFYDEENMTINQNVIGITYEMTRTIENETIRVETIYSIADAMVEKYSL